MSRCVTSVINEVCERLNSFLSRLSRGYLAAEPSMSLVPLAPFLALLGMTEPIILVSRP